MFWSYLWGIEIFSNNEFRFILFRFDLTYEGLKFFTSISNIRFSSRFWSYLWGIEIHAGWIVAIAWIGFDLTYEGLKYRCATNVGARSFTFWSYLWGIEMKSIMFFLLHLFIFVLILLMRDWNVVKNAGFVSILPFWSYLWGIEIQIIHKLLYALSKFWSYLWGIEIIFFLIVK